MDSYYRDRGHIKSRFISNVDYPVTYKQQVKNRKREFSHIRSSLIHVIDGWCVCDKLKITHTVKNNVSFTNYFYITHLLTYWNQQGTVFFNDFSNFLR